MRGTKYSVNWLKLIILLNYTLVALAFISISYDNILLAKLLAQMCNTGHHDNKVTGQMIRHVRHKPTVYSDLNHFIVMNVHSTVILQNLLHSLLQISLTV